MDRGWRKQKGDGDGGQRTEGTADRDFLAWTVLSMTEAE